MVSIECKCPHHRDDLKAIVMYVISGNITPDTWIPCLTCRKIAFYVEEIRDKDYRLRLINGGA